MNAVGMWATWVCGMGKKGVAWQTWAPAAAAHAASCAAGQPSSHCSLPLPWRLLALY